MSKESMSRTGNLLRRTVVVPLLGVIALAGCSTGLDPKHIEFCSEKDSKGAVATMGSGDENDPNVILKYAQDHNIYDKTHRLIHSSYRWDYIDGLGELVCQVRSDNGVTLHFLPQAESIKHDYLTEIPVVESDLTPTTTNAG